MRKYICLMLLAASFFSCNKLIDYLPNPPEALPEFNKLFGGSENDFFAAIEETPDGGYIATGATWSNDGDVSGNHGTGTNDAWVVKLDKRGIIEWQKTLGGTSFEVSSSIVPTPDGGYLLAASTFSDDGDVSGKHGSVDGWLVKLDKVGNLLWQKPLGGSGFDVLNFITKSTHGGYIMVGSNLSNDGEFSGNHGEGDIWVIKIDESGTIQWQKLLGGSASESSAMIINSNDGGYLLTGATFSNDGDVTGQRGEGDAWIVKLDKDGNMLWQKTIGGTGNDGLGQIIKSQTGGYVIIGATYSNDGDVSGNHGDEDGWVVKINEEGNLQWQKTFGTSDFEQFSNLTSAKGGGYVITGVSRTSMELDTVNHGGFDAWIVKLDKNGNTKWQKSIGGTGDEFAGSIIGRWDGSYVIAGQSASTDGDVSGNHGGSDAWVFTLKDD